MRRKDREVTDIAAIFDILRRCDTVRLGIRGEDGPYVVPLSFGAELLDDGRIAVCFHCAREGLKADLIRKDPRVCVEGDIFIRTDTTDHGITTRYESVIGFGNCVFLTDPAEILHALSLLTEHYGYFSYSLNNCRALEHVLVGRVILDRVTGKRNLPG